MLPAIPGEPIRLDARRALLNPGSVGQPRDGIPASAFLVLDDRAATAEFHRVAYDIARTQALMREAWVCRRGSANG